ncbi:MAG: hypothetical protein HN469_08565, partial [Candidatus Marinimicrobia bacterium]|nr:hypothetical protein [Candidatus Neomarinimicrobiota bacterium]
TGLRTGKRTPKRRRTETSFVRSWNRLVGRLTQPGRHYNRSGKEKVSLWNHDVGL